jgi:hypothetical protein
MDARRRELLAAGALATGCALLFGALALLTPAFTDYETEAEPSVQALRSGDWVAFLEQAPAYGGSLVLRAPFALLPNLWGGGDHALFRSMAAPCLLAGVLLAVALWSRARSLGHSRVTWWVVLVLVTANPLTLRALEIGHPEELLGAVLCVAAALAAAHDRPLLAGLLIGLAVANKPWAVLAVVPVAAIAGGDWRRLLVAAASATAVVMLPVAVAGGATAEVAQVARDSSAIFQPWQVWWFFGESGHLVVGTLAEKPGYRVPPGWLTGISHPLVVLIPLALSVGLLFRLRRRPWHDALLLMALALLLRCLLDPWNVSYYALPFLLALVTWEIHAERRPPVVSLGATLLTWMTMVWLPKLVHPDVQAAAYLAWSVPLAALMTVRLTSGHWPALAPRWTFGRAELTQE